ncbi:MAG: metallophosphoesterase [Anaerolineales bacterium]
MKILAVSDQEVERLYVLAANGHFQDIQMILGCGDLPYSYLEYLLSMLNVPLFYVPGNHDPQYYREYPLTYAEGASNLDLRTVRFNDMLLAGLGGSIRYRPDGVNQYSQAEAYGRAWRLLSRLLVQRLLYRQQLDILITHSPPFGIHDEKTQAHQGLKALNFLIRWAQPRYHLHGHTHFFRRNLQSASTQIGRTTVMNIFPYKIIEIAHE